MALENLAMIEALKFCGIEEEEILNINLDGNVSEVLGDSSYGIAFCEKMGIPVRALLSGGKLTQKGINRLLEIGEINNDEERAEELIKAKDFYGELTFRDVLRASVYEMPRNETALTK